MDSTKLFVEASSGELIVQLDVDFSTRVSEIMRATRRALGHGTVCTLLAGGRQLYPLNTLAELGFPPEKRLLAVVGTLKDLMAQRQDATELRSIGYLAAELKEAGYSAMQLKKAGYSASELKIAGYTAQELMVAWRLHIAGDYHGAFNLLNDAGFSAFELKMSGFTARQLRLAGYYGYSAKELKDAYSLNELRDAGYCCKQLKDAGFRAQELKDGQNIHQLGDAGFNVKQLCDAGFSLQELHGAGFSLQELKGVVLNVRELYDIGYSVEQLQQGGFDLRELKDADFTNWARHPGQPGRWTSDAHLSHFGHFQAHIHR